MTYSSSAQHTTTLSAKTESNELLNLQSSKLIKAKENDDQTNHIKVVKEKHEMNSKKSNTNFKKKQ